jgi:hypothetical protein
MPLTTMLGSTDGLDADRLDAAGAATALEGCEPRAAWAWPSPVGVPALRDTPTPPYPTPLLAPDGGVAHGNALKRGPKILVDADPG